MTDPLESALSMTTGLRVNEESSSAPSVFEIADSRVGIDYALRTVQQSQVQFSLMADTKASIMMTVCSIVISASLTRLDHAGWWAPLVVLDVFTAVSLVAALVCVLPSTRRPPMRDGAVDVTSPRFNPLFFMHFRHLTGDQFEREIQARVATPNVLYRALLADIYMAGCVLAQGKYRYLRFSYLSFLAGLIAAFLVLIWQVTLRSP